MATEIVRQFVGGVWKTIAGTGGGGAALTATGGEAGTVADVTTIQFEGATVSESAPGVAAVTGAITIAKAQLTDAQIKTLPTTSVEILGAAPAGFVRIPLFVLLALDTTNGYYDFENIDANATIQILGLTVLAEATASSKVTNFLCSGASSYVLATAAQEVLGTDVVARTGATADVVEAYDILMVNTVGGNLTGGQAGNVMYVTMAYLEVSVTA